ncbi:hypothetical protein FHX33_001218 [Leifsonia aquatica]|uniref:Uncharacterized protein n=1 Tax=Leifsonia aquatica TaxID=144185 RepID=A0A7W4YI03_LEIAQ|nr:hypothetical protein [Leifsonia aquatica]
MVNFITKMAYIIPATTTIAGMTYRKMTFT